MDPKQPTNQLDPKLKEAYERVMGTMPASSTPPQPVTTPPVLPTNPVVPHAMPITNTPPVIHPSSPLPTPASMITPPIMPNGNPPHPIPSATTMPSVSSEPMSQHSVPSQPMMTPLPGQPLKSMEPINPTPISIKAESKPEPVMTTPVNQPSMSHATPMEPMHATVPLSTTTPVHAPISQIHGFVAPKKKAGISPVILIVGGVVFVIVYTLIWVKVFNIPLPFLGQ